MNTGTNSFETIVDNMNEHSSRECEEWLTSKKEVSVFGVIKECIGDFRRSYYKESGKGQGIRGYILAVFEGFGPYFTYAKYWRKNLGTEYPEILSKESSGAAKAVSEDKSSDRWKLSVVIITKNAAEKIRNCMESIKWVDEIVIVDGHSTDGTVEIVKEYTDKVIDSEFNGFGNERNKGAEAATGDWILQLDADEIVTDAFRARLERLLEGEDSGCVSFKFRRKNIFFGRPMMKGGWYHYSAHMFRKGCARYEGDIHEKLVVNGKQGTMEEGVEHYPFFTVSEFIKRQNRYTNLQSGEMYAEDPDISEKTVLFNLKRKPRKLFWKMYLKKGGCEEGMHGFVFSLLFAWVHFIKWAKYWELRDSEQGIENRE
ncbi:MAG: glycosyltransferase family 2 protein [Candidatus Tantalella remota]|nr:glycosyltransferase family 2 protein [Candidatus Tantalella remota]